MYGIILTKIIGKIFNQFIDFIMLRSHIIHDQK